MADTSDIRQRVVDAIASRLVIDADRFTDESTLSSLELDSLDITEAEIAVEDAIFDSTEEFSWHPETTVAEIVAEVSAALERRK